MIYALVVITESGNASVYHITEWATGKACICIQLLLCKHYYFAFYMSLICSFKGKA